MKGAPYLGMVVLAGLLTATVWPADKPETWTEVRAPHFRTVSNAGVKQARHVAGQFEQIRAVFQKLLPKTKVDTGAPITILAVKDEKSLRQLLPQHWERKGQVHPTGEFVSAAEATYVALRVDVTGENPYSVEYHEYVHLLVRLNFTDLPLWLNEGLAEFYAQTRIGDKEISIGEPSVAHIESLRATSLIPMDVLMGADNRSPLYNEANRATIFYAQSWALVHYLLLGNRRAHTPQLRQFLELMQKEDLPTAQAARRAFGDPAELGKALQNYIHQAAFYHLSSPPPALLDERDFPSREIPQAESLALRGDFLVTTNRLNDARPLLEEALRLDPNLAVVHEALGRLALRSGDQTQASAFFSRAVELDSGSYLAHYFAALSTLEKVATSTDLEKPEAGLRRAIELNANFAPAYSALAHLYVLRDEKLEDALALVGKAAMLEPGVQAHVINIGYVLLRMRNTKEAARIAERSLAQARTPEELQAAHQLLAAVIQMEDYEANKKQLLESGRTVGVQSQDVPPPPATGTRVGKSEILAPKPGDLPPVIKEKRTALGRITAVECEGLAMRLTLSYRNRDYVLLTNNYTKIDYLASDWEPPANFNPCHDINGLRANITYQPFIDQAENGALTAIEILKD
jgi:tetratricopeptide (TPR) repeat protein